ncbi:hypothetical protein SpiGrapes_2517 [Sphaerochaeta pleomorpha str. Grapes]|uniref:Uncharacterized protein n=1 Tax=Sphaerochaeta pleomorpha (strain ATCC BAA-1885 / DSM 22778 / Grapes) TaxID=158190 RepID=G8QU31_SPHPG|nr:hypothetical protein [Sphaerochaeta pleomorpha]AEV30278.1 hypothetical protein SpiGrapes_2517 [Sphaerochaeta pleomorpha str. Grapes]
MTKRYYLFAFLIVGILLSFSGCQTYTQRDAQSSIESNTSFSQTPVLETRYSQIAAEKQKKEDALAQQQALLQAQEDAKREELLKQQALLEAQQKAEAEALAIQKTEAEQKQAWEEAQATIASLSKENLSLRDQLESLQLTIEKNIRLEQEKETQMRQTEEARLLEAQKKAQDLADAQEKRLAEIEQLRKEHEAEIMQIPPLDQITFPRPYATKRPFILAKQGEKLNVLMIPLSDRPWEDEEKAAEVAKSISDLQAPVIFLTGSLENVISLVRLLGYNAVLFEGGAILSDFKVVDTTDSGMVIQYNENTTIRLSLANLPQYSVIQAFLQGKDWKALQKKEAPSRIEKVQAIINEGTNTMPTIIGASLYEPSYQDWNTFSPIPYRQMEYLWPLCDTFEQEAFFDGYRLTHYSEATDAGNTIKTKELEERIDYLFSRKALPLQVSVISAGPESIPDSEGIARFALYGSYLIP